MFGFVSFGWGEDLITQVSLQDARQESWDCVIAGSSFAAFFFAKFQSRFKRVLFIERGSFVPHAQRLQAGHPPPQRIALRNHSDHEKNWNAASGFGGGSNCWWAGTPRFHPEDFQLKSRFGIGEDWPITYEDLEEAYCDVEEVMDIAGEARRHLTPRSRPYPAPPHAPSRTDKVLQAHSQDWLPQPTARSNGTRRPVCCANGVCNLCPIDSKFTILNSIDQFDEDGFRLLSDVEVRAVKIEGTTATGILVRDANGSEVEIKSSAVALAANPINNSAILLRSGVENDHLGAGLHEQIGQIVQYDIDHENYFGGTSVTGLGYTLYPGAHRAEHAAVMIENNNAPQFMRLDPGKWTQRLRLLLIAEDLPQARNRVVLDDDEPLIEWHGHHDYAYRGLKNAVQELPNILPFNIEATYLTPVRATESHIQGATRMGETDSDGVIDPNLALFAASNVFCLGAGAFRSCSPANPTLTLSALSIRAARAL